MNEAPYVDWNTYILAGRDINGFYEQKIDAHTHKIIETSYIKEPSTFTIYRYDPKTNKVFVEIRENPNYVKVKLQKVEE